MAITSKHPSYELFVEDWELMRDAYAGERVVKRKGTKYLPATVGQIIDGQGKPGTDGDKAYEAYKTRAVFPEYVSEAVEEYIGLMHKKPAVFELPEGMEVMLERASSEGEGLQSLLRRVHVEQMTTGRLGLLLDFPQTVRDGKPMPYIALYSGETVTNWDANHDKQDIDILSLVVLNESGAKRTGFDWTQTTRYRVLMLANLEEYRQAAPKNSAVITQPAVPEGSSGQVYIQGVFEEREAGAENDLGSYLVPVYLGQPLSEIPFVFLNTKDVISEPDKPPLMPLGRLSMTIYRGEADYRQNLYMQAQDTLVTIGSLTNTAPTTNDSAGEGVRIGAGAHIGLDMGGDAKFIGVGAEGLGEQRSSLENDKSKADTLAGKLMSPSAGKQESGEAMTTRLSAQTASLQQIAQTGAMGLEIILKKAAVWLGLDPDKVKVTPNLEFADTRFVPRDLVDTMTARTMGAPLSLETIHENLKKQGVTEMDFEAEMELISEEDAASALKAASKMKMMAEATGGLQPARPGAKGALPANAQPSPAPAPTPAQK